MKNKFEQISMLGGFYLIIAFFLDLFEMGILETISLVLYLALIIFAFILLINETVTFLDKFKAKFPKISVYLAVVGWNAYLLLPVYISGALIGYNTADAQFNGEEYDANALIAILNASSIVYIVSVIGSLIGATAVVIRQALKKQK